MLAGALPGPWQATAHAADCQGWTFGQPPSPGTQDNELNGVAVLSACDAWAVGTTRNSGGASQTLIEHWDGSSWTVVPSPSPGTAVSELSAVRAVSASDAWAVGDYSDGAGSNQTLILHWNGTAWKKVPSPNPGSFSFLADVAATSAGNAWAAGKLGTPAGDRTLILHWNGTTWTRVPSPNPGASDDLTSVAATSASSAWAAGFTSGGSAQALILHWDGTKWARMTSPAPGPGISTLLSGVAASSTRSALAVGLSESSTTEQGLILRWDGTAWKQVPVPSPGTLSTLSAVGTTSASSAWAVGRFSTTVVGQALAIHCC